VDQLLTALERECGSSDDEDDDGDAGAVAGLSGMVVDASQTVESKERSTRGGRDDDSTSESKRCVVSSIRCQLVYCRPSPHGAVASSQRLVV
jgi:hypothetical protein